MEVCERRTGNKAMLVSVNLPKLGAVRYALG